VAKVLLVGPSLEPVTGQSTAFGYVVSGLCSNESGGQVLHVYNSKGRGWYKAIFFFLFIVKLPFTFLWNRPRIVYLLNSRTKAGFLRDFWVFLFARVFGARMVVHLHGADFDVFLKSLPRAWLRVVDWAYSVVTRAIVLCEGMQEQFSRYPSIAVTVVENCAPTHLLKCSRIAEVSEIRVLYLSNIMASKGVIELLAAVAGVRAKGVPISLSVAGSFLADCESSAEVVRRDFESRFDESYMVYHGAVGSEMKRSLLDWCNIVALPSRYPTEAQPLVLIEGMMSGRYILSSKHNHIPSMLKHEVNAELVSRVGVVEIEGALLKIWSEREKSINNRCNGPRRFVLGRVLIEKRL